MASIAISKNKNGSTTYTVRWRDAAGRSRNQAESDPEVAEAVKAEVERTQASERVVLQRRGVEGKYIHLLNATVQEAGDAFLDTYIARSTRVIHQTRLRVHVYPYIGERKLDSIRPMDIEALKNKWGGALSARRGYYTTLSALFTWADKNSLLTGRNPFKGDVDPPRSAKRATPDAWPEEWIEGALRHMRRDFSLFPYLGSFCGLRQGEIFGLDPDDFMVIDGQRIIRIRRQVKIIDARLYFAPPKHRIEADDPRDIPVPDFVWDAKEEFLRRRSPRPVTLPWDDPHTSQVEETRAFNLMFTSREGKAINRNFFNPTIWKPTLESVGIPTTRENGTHALRHWFSCKALENGISITRLAYLLGHADPAFTLRIYGRFQPAANREVASVMEQFQRMAVAPSQEDTWPERGDDVTR